MTSKVELKIQATVNPSEQLGKVISAITNIFNGCSPELKHGSLIVATCIGYKYLTTVYDQIRARSAIGVLRRMLTNNQVSNTTRFLLNKQAAVAGTLVVIEDESESPLGPIRVTIICDELDSLIDWLAPLE